MSSPLDLFFFGLNRRPGRLPRCSELCEGSFFKAHLLEIIETGNEWNEWKLKQKAMKLQQSGPILERYAVPRRETSRLLHHTKHRYFHCFFSISSMNSVVFHGIFMAFPFFIETIPAILVHESISATQAPEHIFPHWDMTWDDALEATMKIMKIDDKHIHKDHDLPRKS